MKPCPQLSAFLALAALAWSPASASAGTTSKGSSSKNPKPAKTCDSCSHTASEKLGESAISGDLGLNIVTSSYYRGVNRAGTDHAPSLQPNLNLYLKAYEGDGFLNKAVLSLGLWQSFINPAFYKAVPGAKAPVSNSSWYESNFTPSLALTFGKLTLTETYHFILYPNQFGKDAQGLSSRLAFDDSDLLGMFALNPAITHTFETSGKLAFANPTQSNKGHSWEFSIAPSASAGAFTLTLPVSLVFGSGGFYYSNGYAYLSAGLHLSYALPLPKNYGNWSVNTGATYYNSDSKATRNPTSNDVVGSVGLGVAF